MALDSIFTPLPCVDSRLRSGSTVQSPTLKLLSAGITGASIAKGMRVNLIDGGNQLIMLFRPFLAKG